MQQLCTSSTARAPFLGEDLHAPAFVSASTPWRLKAAPPAGSTRTLVERTMMLHGPGGRPLKLPIVVDVRHSGDSVTVVHQATGIYGAGATRSEATQDFLAALAEYRDVLVRQESLSPDLRDLLAYLVVQLG